MDKSRILQFGPQELVFMEGDPGDRMFIVQKGRLVVQKRAGAKTQVLAELQAGSILGEMSLLDNEPRSATVKTLEHSTLIAITQEDLEATFKGTPKWFSAIFRMLTSRLREVMDRRYAYMLASSFPGLLLILLDHHKRSNSTQISLKELERQALMAMDLETHDLKKLIAGLVRLGWVSISVSKKAKFIEILSPAGIQYYYEYLALQFKNEKHLSQEINEEARELLQAIFPLAQEIGEVRRQQILIEERLLARHLDQSHPQWKRIIRHLQAFKLLASITGTQEKKYIALQIEPVTQFLQACEFYPKIADIQLEKWLLKKED
jgi:CRP-like cAMP-binding protein